MRQFNRRKGFRRKLSVLSLNSTAEFHVNRRQTITQAFLNGHGSETSDTGDGSEFKMKAKVWTTTFTLSANPYMFLLVSFFLIIIPVHSLAQSNRWPQLRRSSQPNFLSRHTTMCSQMCRNQPYNPVCGNDMITYSNECELRYTRTCRGKTQLALYRRGKCTNDQRMRRRTCSRMRYDLLRQFDQQYASPTHQYIPVCREDGTFKKIQCDNKKGICFCVNRRTGRPKSNTMVRYPKTPKCGNGGGRPRKKGRVDKCSPKLRKQFNDNLIHQFKIEFDRVVQHRQNQRAKPVKRNIGDVKFPVKILITGEAGFTLNSTELRVVEWKFSELDGDSNNYLSFHELRSLRRVVRRIVKPRACARRFAKRCDTNKNKRIERIEWSACMGINTASFVNPNLEPEVKQPEIEQAPKASIIGLIKRRVNGKPTHRQQNCLAAQREAMQKNSEDPGTKVFVPQCTAEGFYKRQQCHHVNNGEKLCFCMHPGTGQVMKGAVDCRLINKIRPFKGCKDNKKERFLTELLDTMVQDTQKYWGQHPGPEMNSNIKLLERALRWKFYLLDINKNKKLDRKEMRMFKLDIKKKILSSKRRAARDLRKCVRNFMRYCDANSDRTLSLDELIQCTDINKKTNPRATPLGFSS